MGWFKKAFVSLLLFLSCKMITEKYLKDGIHISYVDYRKILYREFIGDMDGIYR